MWNNSKELKQIAVSLILLFILMVPVVSSGSLSDSFSSRGSVNYNQVSVRVDSSLINGFNALSLGFQLSYGSLGAFQNFTTLRQLAREACFKLVRFNDILKSPWMPTLMPCTQFNETTKKGTYDWTNVDDIVEKVLEIQAQPLICLGAFSGGIPMLPPGMAVDPATGLPDPESYASYAVEWVKHFLSRGWDQRYYEIFNEPWVYFCWEPVDLVKLGNYMHLFNVVATRMREENPNLIISFDFICRKPVMDYWLTHGGVDVDSLNFHDYGTWVVGQSNDAEMFAEANSDYFGMWPMGQSLIEAQQTWFNARGERLPIICSESNFNGASVNGTDQRIQQMAGAVWLAMVLRNEILAGVRYHIYFELACNRYLTKSGQSSYGFGMINYLVQNGSFEPWNAYYLQGMLGDSLAPNDSLIETECSSNDLETLAWLHNGTINILLICKVDQYRTVEIHGLQNQIMDFLKVDNTVSWDSARLQAGKINSTEPLVIKGYAVVMLHASIAPS